MAAIGPDWAPVFSSLGDESVARSLGARSPSGVLGHQHTASRRGLDHRQNQRAIRSRYFFGLLRFCRVAEFAIAPCRHSVATMNRI